MLDAIICPEWDSRYYSYNSKWAPGMEMASMRNGCGDDWFLLFDAVGAALKGFAHELAGDNTFTANLTNQVPAAFANFLGEPAFSMGSATFCYWRGVEEGQWNKVHGLLTDDGSDEMLSLLVAGPLGYKSWAESYFEIEVDLQTVTAVFDHAPLTEEIILALNPEADVDLVLNDADEIGYAR